MPETDSPAGAVPLESIRIRKPLTASWGSPSGTDEDLQRHLLKILDLGRITTVFQPLFDLRTAEVFAYEALSRVVGPSRFSGPGELFQAAQHCGMTARLEALCRKRSLERAREMGIEEKLTLNVCPSVLLKDSGQGGLPDLLEDVMDFRESVILELTERFHITNQEAFRKVAGIYREHGFRIAIDDLGSGFTGFKMLAELEPYLVKIDRYLVAGLQHSPNKRLLLQAVVSYCHKINARVVAEGVETSGELQELCAMGVDLGQGFYLARPNPEPAGCNPRAREQIMSLQPKATPVSESPNSVGSLMRFVEPVSLDTTNEALIEIFQGDDAPSAVPVLDGKLPVGIVHKTKLFYRLGQRFGYSLFSRKWVDSIVEPVLVFDAGTPLEEVSRRSMSRDEHAIYDSVVVVQNGDYAGMVTMHHLYERITEQKILLASQANPLTGLPGNNLIKQEIMQRLDNRELFAVIYADLDHFKPFNDYHGFARGDSVIRFLSDLLKRCVREWDYKGFVGHVGGDDFVIVCRAQGVETLCRRILDRFDEEAKTFHDAETVRRGYYEGSDRRGTPRHFPLLSLSLAVVSTLSRVIVSYGQLVSIASEVKKKAKDMPGSSVFIDRRQG